MSPNNRRSSWESVISKTSFGTIATGFTTGWKCRRTTTVRSENCVQEVIARKVSFGSQSGAGAKTRGVLMSLVQTLAKRVADPESHFKSVLDQLAEDPSQDPPVRSNSPRD